MNRTSIIFVLREIEKNIGIGHSRVTLDVFFTLYELLRDRKHRLPGVSPDQIASFLSISAPTVRAALTRLVEAGSVTDVAKVGRTHLYALSNFGESEASTYLSHICKKKAQEAEDKAPETHIQCWDAAAVNVQG